MYTFNDIMRMENLTSSLRHQEENLEEENMFILARSFNSTYLISKAKF